MTSLVSIILTLTVFMWLLPLGTFIKRSQEKTACGGHRAFHMCSMEFGNMNMTRPADSTVKISSGAGFNENAKSSSSSGPSFLAANFSCDVLNEPSKFYPFLHASNYPLVLRTLEHVPLA